MSLVWSGVVELVALCHTFTHPPPTHHPQLEVENPGGSALDTIDQNELLPNTLKNNVRGQLFPEHTANVLVSGGS